MLRCQTPELPARAPTDLMPSRTNRKPTTTTPPGQYLMAPEESCTACSRQAEQRRWSRRLPRSMCPQSGHDELPRARTAAPTTTGSLAVPLGVCKLFSNPLPLSTATAALNSQQGFSAPALTSSRCPHRQPWLCLQTSSSCFIPAPCSTWEFHLQPLYCHPSIFPAFNAFIS